MGNPDTGSAVSLGKGPCATSSTHAVSWHLSSIGTHLALQDLNKMSAYQLLKPLVFYPFYYGGELLSGGFVEFQNSLDWHHSGDFAFLLACSA